MSNLPTKLNKSQQRDIAKIIVNGASLGDDYMARGLSALYRSAMKPASKMESWPSRWLMVLSQTMSLLWATAAHISKRQPRGHTGRD